MNPVSGDDTGPSVLPALNEKLLKLSSHLDIVLTTGPGDAARAAERAAADGYEGIFVAGGDGTLNEVVNGIARAGALDRVTFGLVPLGTGNDFAVGLGIPPDYDAAAEILQRGKTLNVDVGVLNGRHFVNVSGGGFIAEVSEAVTEQMKTIAGKLAYLVGGAQVLLDYDPVGVHATYLTDRGKTERRELPLHMFAVCNSRLVGGGRLIAPEAVINDGFLDMCLVEGMGTLEFVGLLAKVANGDHIEDDRVIYERVRRAELRFDRVINVNTDGEVLETDHCTYEVLPRAARFLCGDAPYAATVAAEPAA